MKISSRFFQANPLIGKIMVGFFVLTGFFVNAQTPVAYYPFTGNANHGTVNGATLTTDRFGNANGAYSFDGVDDFITVPSGNFTAYTISAWVSFVASPADRGIVTFTSGSSSGAPYGAWSHQIRTNGSGKFRHYSAIPGAVNLDGNTTALQNEWYHVTISANANGEMRLYVNGTPDATPINIGIPWASGTHFHFGNGSGSGANYLHGAIDEVKIFNTQLTDAQVLADYSGTAPPPPTPIAHYPFTGNANDAIGSNHGTVNGASLTTDRYGNTNSAYSFDGVDDVILFSSPFTTAIDNFTISAWVKLNSTSSGGQIVSNGRNPGAGFPANLYDGYSYGTGGGSLSANYHAVIAPAGGCAAQSTNWEFVVLVREAGITKLYLNGVQCTNTFTNAPVQPTTAAFIGALNGNSLAPFDGKIDDVKIYNTALTAAQVLTEYTYSQPDLASYASQFGNSVEMISSPDRVEIPANAALSLTTFTIEAWIKTTQTGTSRRIVTKPLVGDQNYSLFMNNGLAVIYFDQTTGGPVSVTGTKTINDGNWHHLAGTYDEATNALKLYVDGQLDGQTTTANDPMTGSSGVNIGIFSTSFPANNFVGNIDEVRIWNTARTAAEIQNNMNAQLAGTETGLVGYWDMNRNGQGAGLTVDNKATATGAALNGTTAGTASTPIFLPTVAQQAPGSGNAISFDGTNDFITSGFSSAFANDFTIEAWVNPSGTIVIPVQANSGVGAVSGQRFVLMPALNGTTNSSSDAGVGFAVGTNGITVVEHSASYMPATLVHQTAISGWNHVAIVYINKIPKLYLNGVYIKDGLVSGKTNVSVKLMNNNLSTQVGGIGGGTSGGSGENPNFFLGSIDEFRVWNTSLTEAQIRDRMCRKITSSDPLYSNLVAYYNFDESTGNTAFDGSAGGNNGTLLNGPALVTSGAAIGNTSAHSYAGASSTVTLAHPTRGDNLTSTLTSGAADGIHVYHVNEEPNNRTGVNGLPSNNSYFGTFVVGGTNATYNAVYNYDGIPAITDENSLVLYNRSDNSAAAWSSAQATLNTTANTLTKTAATAPQDEYIVGMFDAGSISASQTSCFEIVPQPLTGTPAFNNDPATTYQWQDSNGGGVWTNIPGATNGTTYAPPFLSSPKYYRRLATLNTLTLPSNEVFLDIRGAISPAIIPLNQWNVYAYNGSDLNLGAGTSYQGYYSVSGLVVNSESLWNQNAAPSAAPGYKGCEVNQAPWTLAVKRQGFPDGNYVLNITSVDNSVRAYLNGNQIFAAPGFGPYPNITLGALDANSVVEVRAENSGGPGYLNFNLQTSALQGGTISADQSNCAGFIPALLNNVNSAFGGSLLNITYQWQQSPNNITFTDISGATSDTYQPTLVTTDIYFRRKASNANNETAFSNVVFMDITGPTFYADLDEDGFGDPGNFLQACTQPSGYVTDNTDCNDTDPLQRPGQVWYIDMDNDGYVSSNGPGQPALTITQCSRPAGGKVAAELVTTVGRDCDDNDPTINPMAQRLTVSSSPDFANGVFPLQGDPSTTFFFEAIYYDDNNALPSVTFPRAYLDFESNFIINQPQDRIVVMTEFDAADQNTFDGKKYTGSVSGLPNGSTWQTFLISEFSNTCQRGTGPFPHPDVLLQPNVQIFANYIQFSDNNPPVSSPVTITAYVGNPSDFAVQNVAVRLRNQAEPNTVYPDITIPYIAAHTSGVASWNITTPSFNGICPMQVTVDFPNTIVETNELDNVAVSSFNNGSVPVTGDIIVEANVVPATSYASANNTLHLNFNATFNGTNLPPELKVAGALVTFQIDETGSTFTGFTSANGNIYIPFTAPVSPGVYHISGTVSSPPFTGNINPNITTFELLNGNDPDYTVTITAPVTTCLAGESVSHTIVVNNNGLVTSTVNTQLTLSIPGGNPSLLTFTVPPIAAGSSYTINDVIVQFPTAGTYNVCAQADVLQEINELNESNNSSCLNITVALSMPDLEVISGSSGPQTICNPISLSAGIRNAGGVSSAASTSRMVVKLGNTTVQTFNHSVPALGPFGEYSYQETFIPASSGTYTYTVEADVNQVVTEANESNNINTFTITVTPCLPDLIAGDCDLAATSATNYASGNMTLSATITNVGETATSSPVTVRFQFSNNTFVNAVHSGAIPKGQSVTVTATTAAFVNPGVTMKAIVDPNNSIAEINEANNESLSKPTAWDLAFTNSVLGCGPDLTNFIYKPFFSYYLPVKISNYSLYTAATVKVRYQISGPGLIGTVNIATVEAYNVLTNCVVCPQGVSLPSPFVFPQTGTYTITLTIDPDNEYVEVNESNNVWVVTVEVSNKPDMRIVSSFINPTLLNPAIGEPITVSVTYDNIGASNVNDQMKMKLFIDNVVIETVSGLSGLAANNYATVNFTVPWSSTIPGTHVIKAFIDSDNGIVENDEDNNIATRAVIVGSSANLWVKSLSVLNYYPNLNDNINIKAKIENQGDLPTNALVSVYYVNNSLENVLIRAQSVSLPGRDSISLNIPWIVVDNKTRIVVVISNSSAPEYNYNDNTAFIELGKMALFLEAFPACETGNKGTMTAYINGGEPPYTYAWSNGSVAKSITADADTYSVTVFDATGQQVSGSDIIPPCTGMLLNVKCYLQGYYIAQNLMASVLTRSGIISPLEYTDTITVRLHAPTVGLPLVASCKAILHNNGSITCEFPASVLGSSRYIVLEHRNSIETWSAAPVLISNNMMYDFSNAANKAFGNNLLLMMGGTYAIYGGDVNQDGSVDTADMTPVDNDAANYEAGYIATDVNGDGAVDTADMTIVDNNGADYVTVATP